MQRMFEWPWDAMDEADCSALSVPLRCSVATAIIGSAVVGAGASIYSSNQAANAQEQASQQAQDTQLQMFHEAQRALQPYNQVGQQAFGNLMGALPGLTAPFNPTMEQLAATPGYQFTLGQGLKATQNAYAAQGLGSSGAALKGAANYAEGLAGTTYQQQFQNYLGQNAQIYNMLYGPAALGENAAAGVGNAALQTGAGVAQSQQNAGAAQAAGYLASGQAVGNAAASVPASLFYAQAYGQPGAYGQPAGNGAASGLSGWIG